MDTFARPHEMEFGPDGSLYVIEWGSGFGGNNLDSGIYRIDYMKGGAAADRHRDGHAGLRAGAAQVAVLLARAPTTPRARSLTYAWDFDGNGTTDSTEANPTHTYTHGRARFNVHADRDRPVRRPTGTDTVQVIAGNTRPTVEIEIPENGQFADFGDNVPYKISVTDPEDGDDRLLATSR